MADAGLVPGRRRGERAPQLVGDEDRIVAETAATVGVLGDGALAEPLRADDATVGPRQSDHAAKARSAIAGASETLEEDGDALGARRREARRAHAGRPGERVDLEPGIVPEGRQPRRQGHGPCLGDGVLEVARLTLGRQRDAPAGEVLRDDISPFAHQGGQLGDLARVRRGEDEAAGDHFAAGSRTPAARSVRRCRVVRRASPALPTDTSRLSWRSVNGSPSAAPWTSTNRPAPVITRFMSTAARWSSS